MDSLFRTPDIGNYKSDFVALAATETSYDDCTVLNHAYILISHNGNLYQYEFDGQSIQLDEFLEAESIIGITKIVPSTLIPSFISHCKAVYRNANPKFGYFFGGEHYDANGAHFSSFPVKETMTCVGFCLNILTGFLGIDYINWKDWPILRREELPLRNPDYLLNFAKDHDVPVEEIIESHRRIDPTEFVASSLFETLPVKKVKIDQAVSELKEDYELC